MLNVFNLNAKVKISTSGQAIVDLYCSTINIVSFIMLRSIDFDIVMDPV